MFQVNNKDTRTTSLKFNNKETGVFIDNFEHISHLFLLFFLINFGHICDALRDLVPFVQFKKREKRPWRRVTFSKAYFKQVYFKFTLSNFTKSNTPPWVFFTNCTNGTKLRKTSYICLLEQRISRI